MSNRFEIITNEMIGPLGKLVLKDGIFSSDITRVLSFNNLTNIEKLIHKTLSSLPDGKKTFVLLFLLSIKHPISKKTLFSIYNRLDSLRKTLTSKIALKDYSTEVLIKLSRAYLRPKYPKSITEKLLSFCSSILKSSPIPFLKYLTLGKDFEMSKGLTIRGQCRFQFQFESQITGIGLMKKIEPMEIAYSGPIEEIYDDSLIKINSLSSQLISFSVQVLISETSHDWVKQACSNCKVLFFESPHPADVKDFWNTSTFTETKDFFYTQSLAEIQCLPHISILKILDVNCFTLVFPEHLGSDYQTSFESLSEIWKTWQESFLLVYSGFQFEIALAKELAGTGLDLVFLQFLNTAIHRLPKGRSLWKDFLSKYTLPEGYLIDCDIDSGGVSVLALSSKNLESFDLKFKLFETLLEVLIQFNRIDHSLDLTCRPAKRTS